MPLLSRLYTPVQFGLLGLFLAIISISSTVITLRYEAVILIPKSENRAQSLTLLAIILSVVLSLVLSAVLYFVPQELTRLLGIADLGNWSQIAVLAAMGSACGTIIANWLNRNNNYSTMARIKIAQSMAITFIALSLGYLGIINGLLYAQIVSSMLLFGFAVFVVLRDFNIKETSNLLLPVAREHKTAPLFLLPTALLDTVTLQLPVILIASFFSTDTSGQFSMAWRLLALPISLIGMAIAQVFYQRFSNAWPDAAKARALLFNTWKFLFMAGIIPTIIVIVFGKQIFALALGNAWTEAGVIASILAPMLFVSFIHSTTSVTLIVIGKERLGILFGLAVLIYRPLCLLVGFYYGNLRLGLTLFMILEIVQMCVYQYIVLKGIQSKLNAETGFKKMKAVILAGGLGTRISEETMFKPKPMIEIGGMPILWHIMKIYSAHGVNDFIICCGYKGHVIKEYFANYILQQSDVTFDLSKNTMEIHKKSAEPWRVTLVDTGLETMTGGRLKRVAPYIENEEAFCFTYGDGVSDIDIKALIEFHRKHKLQATVTTTYPPSRYGYVGMDGDKVVSFKEKPHGEGGRINGGFFVLSPSVLKLIDGDHSVWETDGLDQLTEMRQLAAYHHEGFWHAMDTLRDKNHLEALWAKKAPWKVWA